MPRTLVVTAVLVSLGLHALLLLGPKLLTKKPRATVAVESPPVIRLVVPDLKELDEPEVVDLRETESPPDLAIPVPMQADLPSLPTPNDFVQPLNIASLLEQPDLSRTNLTVIPEHYLRATRIAERIGKIFNLEDLDRIPEPVFQPAPNYPHSMRREGLSATVMVEFIVDLNGRVLEPAITESTHTAFNDAAVAGVARWKFRAGVKGGRTVHTRMRVPIVFTLAEPLP